MHPSPSLPPLPSSVHFPKRTQFARTGSLKLRLNCIDRLRRFPNLRIKFFFLSISLNVVGTATIIVLTKKFCYEYFQNSRTLMQPKEHL